MRKMMSRPRGRGRNTAMLGAAALVLLMIVGLLYVEWQRYHHANADAAQTREIDASVTRLLSDLLNGETGERGYLLTGENRYLQPYNQAVQSIPGELARLKDLLALRQRQAPDTARLSDLVDQKLTELRQTIEIRRTQGATPALAAILNGQGKQTMDEIRAFCAAIQRRETTAQNAASTEGEAAAGTALLITVAGSLLLLFLFAFGLEPYASPDPQAQRRSWPLRYGAAVLAVAVIALLRAALTPIIGDHAMPFTLFFPAVWFAAWFGGVRPGVLAVVLSVLAGDYFFAEPIQSLMVRDHDDQVAMLTLVIVGLGMALLSRSQQRAVARAMQAENAERSERQRFETTLASIGDAVIATDAEGRVTLVNKVALSLMRCTEAEVAGKQLDEVFRIVNAHTRAAVESPVARVLREGAIVGFSNHTILLACDGTEVPIDDSAAPIRDGNMVAGVVLIFRDITERLKAQERMRLTVEAAPNAMILVSQTGQIELVNTQAEKLFGYRRDELVGEHVEILVPERYRGGHGALRASFLRDPVARAMGAGRDLFGVRKDGAEVPIEIGLNPIRTGEGDFVLAAIIDISERKRAEENLRAANKDLRVSNAALSRANEDLNQFAFAASHDLQEPLRMIAAYSQLLVKGYKGQLDSEASTCIDFITQGTKRMRDLLADLLAYTQLSGDEEEAVASVDLNDVFETAVENCRAAIDEAGASVTSVPLPAVPGHKSHFVQLFQNLISNGIKYRSRRPPQVHVSAQSQNGFWLISVQDNGMGIEPEYHKQVFGVFKRLHGKTIPGTGIGLAICKRVVERYGGEIWVESSADQGATFRFTLPGASNGAAEHD